MARGSRIHLWPILAAAIFCGLNCSPARGDTGRLQINNPSRWSAALECQSNDKSMLFPVVILCLDDRSCFGSIGALLINSVERDSFFLRLTAEMRTEDSQILVQEIMNLSLSTKRYTSQFSVMSNYRRDRQTMFSSGECLLIDYKVE
jgi:hypothetical protein